MKDSLFFPLVLATVFLGALLAVFDPANRSTTVAETKSPAALSTSSASSATTTTPQLPS